MAAKDRDLEAGELSETISDEGEPSEEALGVVAPLVADYYQWLSGHGGQGPDELLSIPLTPDQRKLLQIRMDDILVLWGLTAPTRAAQKDLHMGNND